MLDVFLIIIILVLFAPCCLIFHELGHVYAAKLVKSDHVELSIGLGKQIWQGQIKGVHMYIQKLFLINSFTSSHRKQPYSKHEKILISVMGPLFSLLLAMLLFIVYGYLYTLPVIYVLHLFNLWVSLVNLIPFKVGQKVSDGYTIYKQLT